MRSAASTPRTCAASRPPTPSACASHVALNLRAARHVGPCACDRVLMLRPCCVCRRPFLGDVFGPEAKEDQEQQLQQEEDADDEEGFSRALGDLSAENFSELLSPADFSVMEVIPMEATPTRATAPPNLPPRSTRAPLAGARGRRRGARVARDGRGRGDGGAHALPHAEPAALPVLLPRARVATISH